MCIKFKFLDYRDTCRGELVVLKNTSFSILGSQEEKLLLLYHLEMVNVFLVMALLEL